MEPQGYFHWHNILLVALIAAIATDILFGLDPLLNAISTAGVVGSMLVGAGVIALAAAAIFWITVRDLIDDIRTDRKSRIAWRWKFLAIIGVLGILVDGFVGAWNAYQKHIQFSSSVEAIPFSGVPVFLLIASYPFKWAEQYFERRRRNPDVN